YSPVYDFQPDGLVFEAPVRVELPFAGDTEVATIFWTSASGGSYIPLQTTLEDGAAVTQITHFSEAFVGSACMGDDCCSRATGELDVLLVVDNSNSMEEEQVSLAQQLPRMARVLATGDLDGDGTQDAPAVSSLRIGVVTADMGTGGVRMPTCVNPDGGDDAVLRTQTAPDMGCPDMLPPFASYVPGDDTDAFATDVSCVALAGVGGCGFEQQLEAGLMVVPPADSAITFVDGRRGHAGTGA